MLCCEYTVTIQCTSTFLTAVLIKHPLTEVTQWQVIHTKDICKTKTANFRQWEVTSAGELHPHLAEAPSLTEHRHRYTLVSPPSRPTPGFCDRHFGVTCPDHSNEQAVPPQRLPYLQETTGIHTCYHSKICRDCTYDSIKCVWHLKPAYLHSVPT